MWSVKRAKRNRMSQSALELKFLLIIMFSVSVYVSVGVSVALVGLRFLYSLVVLPFGLCESIHRSEKGDEYPLIALTYTHRYIHGWTNTNRWCRSVISLIFSLLLCVCSCRGDGWWRRLMSLLRTVSFGSLASLS